MPAALPIVPISAVLAGLAVAFLAWWFADLAAKAAAVRRSFVGQPPPPNLVDSLGLRNPVEFVLARFNGLIAGPGRTIDQKLVYAGRPFGGITGEEYIALVAVMAVIGALLLGVLFGLALGNPIGGFLAGLILGLLPAVYFWVLVDDRVHNRRDRISREFPYFLDLVVMTQQAQATLPESLRLYAEAAPDTAMAEEIDQVLKDVGLGTGVIEALQRLERRLTAEEVVRVIRAVIQGEIEGSNRLELLREHARDLRFRRWEKAERASEQLRAKIVMPAMMIVVSILLLVLAPAVVEMTTSGMF